MSNTIINTDNIDIKHTTSIVANNQINVDIITDDPIVKINSNEYVLSSSGIYGNGNNLIGAVPNWLLNAIQQELTTGSGNIMDMMNDLRMAMNSLSIGVTQSISSLNTAMFSQSSLITGLKSVVDNNSASIIDILATRVDATQAMAISANAIESKFGTDISAFVGNIASTYVDANSSIAQDMSLIASTLNDVSSSVSTIATATTEQKINPLWINDGLGTTPDVNGHDKYITVALAQQQFVVDANGVITSLILSSGATSSITMNADEFKLVASGQSAISRNPFTVNATTGEISLNGKVTFSNISDASTNIPTIASVNTAQSTANTAQINAINAQTTANSKLASNADLAALINANTTTIDGGKITAGSVLAGQLAANAIYGKTILIDDTSNPAGSISNGGTLGLFTTNIQQNAIAGVSSVSGGHGVAGVNYNTTSGVGVYGEGNWGVTGKTFNASGEWGFITDYKTYSLGGYFPFTGAHITYSTSQCIVGDIVEVQNAWVLNVNQTAVWITPTVNSKNKAILGVVSYQKNTMLDNIEKNILLTDVDANGNYIIKPEYAEFISSMQADGFKEVSVNALGEGGMNVCNENGNIDIGDYICSSNILGKGMKQDDDILHNYTVAKALEAVDWSKETQTTKMIACTYHCG